MSQSTSELVQLISENISLNIDQIIKTRFDKAPFDKTYAGIISEILFEPGTKPDDIRFGQYKVRYGNSERKFKLNDGLVHEIGERVTVHVFENDPNRIVVYPNIDYIVPSKVAYDEDDEDTDSVTITREVKTNNQIYKIEDKYKLKIKNKNTKDVEISQVTLPNGQIVEFSGFNVYF